MVLCDLDPKYVMQPPESPHDGVPFGQCRWCGEDVFKRNGRIDFKSNWHKDCRAEMELVYEDDLMRKAISVAVAIDT